MKQSKTYKSLCAIGLGACLLTGCAAHNTERRISLTPSPCILTPDTDRKAMLDVTFHVPGNYISRRSRLVVVPQLTVGDSLLSEYQPIAIYSPIYSKKMERRRVLEDYIDIYDGHIVKVDDTSRDTELRYSTQVELPADVDSARLVAMVSTDGCGECSGLQTVDVASVVMPAPPKRKFNLFWIEPEFKVRPKVMVGKGVANLQFVINKYDINLSMGNNRRELDNMVAKLSLVLGDSLATLTSLKIFGMASADGPLSFNTPLSRNRANSAKDWLVGQLGISADVQRLIKVGSRPEGWQPVYEAMAADAHPDAGKVKAILDRYADQNDDVAERYIRRLACWKDIRERYLQKDRKVEYVYTYTIRSFTTDAELLDMYSKRPDAFNEDELLRVASLATDDKKRMVVYLILLKRFPQSAIVVNNLAVLYLRAGKEDEAIEVLKQYKADDRFEKIINQ